MSDVHPYEVHYRLGRLRQATQVYAHSAQDAAEQVRITFSDSGKKTRNFTIESVTPLDDSIGEEALDDLSDAFWDDD
jgi:hypothetical protein